MKKLLMLILFLLISGIAFAEIIYLKDGKKIEGKIIEKTDEFIIVDLDIGLNIKYYLDEIDKIDEEGVVIQSQNEEDVKAIIKNAVGYVKKEVTDVQHMAKVALARGNLMSLSSSIEMYASRHNYQYPTDMNEVIQESPHIKQNYCEEEVNGLKYNCELSKEGYTISVQVGPEVYQISTGGIMTP